MKGSAKFGVLSVIILTPMTTGSSAADVSGHPLPVMTNSVAVPELRDTTLSNLTKCN
jgi:hypothetical protein